jgi:hypothetical protein
MSLITNTTTYTVLLYLPTAAMQDWMWFWGQQGGGRLFEAGIKMIAMK